MSERGFTLVELLVAIVVVSLTTVMLASGVGTIGRSLGRQHRNLDQASEISAVADFLRIAIADARPIAPPGMIQFDGTATRFSVISPSPNSLPKGGLFNYTLEIVAGTNSGAALRVTWYPFQNAATNGSGRVLLDDLRDLHVAYFAAEGNQSPQWHDAWRGTTLPLLIRFHMILASGAAPPDLIIAPHLSPPETPRNARRF